MEPLVSIVTPCYNGENFIDNYMRSILGQTYKNIELILVDDGSTDNSYRKIMSWEERMKSMGICFRHLQKENGGQPTAINAGIKLASGKYISWPDIDDRMHADYIEKKVRYMESNPECDFLISQSAIVKLNEPDKILGYTWTKAPEENVTMVNRLLNDRDVWFEPGAFFAKMTSFDKFIENRTIYDACGIWSGPQTQILMPFFYYGRIGYLKECLYDYHIHGGQDHSKIKSKADVVKRCEEVRKMLIATIKALNVSESEERRMISIAEERMIRTEEIIAFQQNDRNWFLEAYGRLSQKQIAGKDRIRFLIMKNRIVHMLYQLSLSLHFRKNYIQY